MSLGTASALPQTVSWRDGGGANRIGDRFLSARCRLAGRSLFPGLSAISGITTMGSTYLQTHEPPWYVTAGKEISSVDGEGHIH
jgi:hypothetical protein